MVGWPAPAGVQIVLSATIQIRAHTSGVKPVGVTGFAG